MVLLKLPTVLMADDHVLVADAIGKLLEGKFELAGKVADGDALVRAARELQPDLILADISMPIMSGIDVTRQILSENPEARVVFITQHTDPQYVRGAMRAGALGYVIKQSASSELLTALKYALRRERYISPRISAESLRMSPFNDPLTSRQREVLRLVADGLSAREIAKALGITPKTVEFHKAALMDKLGLRSTAQLTRYALAHHLVS
jgi:DNA-binding NarL/FixJ family response regulator